MLFEKKVIDEFYKGTPWKIGLRRFVNLEKQILLSQVAILFHLASESGSGYFLSF